MIKVLNILSSLDGGGVESMITNYYYNFPYDDIIFDFIVHNKKVGILEEPLLERGSKIYHVTPKKENAYRNIKELWKIINKDYNIVYCHQNFISWIPLLIAKIKGVKIRIVHSHGCNPPKTFKRKMYNYISRMLINVTATNFFACGSAAANWLYGNKWSVNQLKNIIINNAIDINKFSYSDDIRANLKNKYNVNDKKCILHVGRFSPEKNHKFVIDIMTHLPKEEYHLFLAGNGDLISEIEQYAKEMNVKNVTFLGVRKDVNELYSMADIVLLPSFHEGFPVILVEAQATGVYCIASTNVSTETKITDNLKFLPINDANLWADEIKKVIIKKRKTEYELVKNAGFDIKTEAIKFYNTLKLLIK